MDKPYTVSWEWGDYESFATFAEALAFRDAEHPGWHISNADNADDEGDGLTRDEMDQLD